MTPKTHILPHYIPSFFRVKQMPQDGFSILHSTKYLEGWNKGLNDTPTLAPYDPGLGVPSSIVMFIFLEKVIQVVAIKVRRVCYRFSLHCNNRNNKYEAQFSRTSE